MDDQPLPRIADPELEVHRWNWVFLIVWGICSFFCFYLVYFEFRSGVGFDYAFAGLGLLFGLGFVSRIIAVLSRRSLFFEKLHERISPKPEPVRATTFVSDWFTMGALMLVFVAILASFLIARFF